MLRRGSRFFELVADLHEVRSETPRLRLLDGGGLFAIVQTRTLHDHTNILLVTISGFHLTHGGDDREGSSFSEELAGRHLRVLVLLQHLFEVPRRERVSVYVVDRLVALVEVAFGPDQLRLRLHRLAVYLDQQLCRVELLVVAFLDWDFIVCLSLGHQDVRQYLMNGRLQCSASRLARGLRCLGCLGRSSPRSSPSTSGSSAA